MKGATSLLRTANPWLKLLEVLHERFELRLTCRQWVTCRLRAQQVVMVYGEQAASKVLLVVLHGHSSHCLNVDGSDFLIAGKCLVGHVAPLIGYLNLHVLER
jgi:hypothetical protein